METIQTERSVSIRSFFSGRRVLVTGVTGFLGRVLVEKILRSLEDVERIHLVVRPGRGGVDPVVRFDREVIASSVFRRLRSEWGAAFERRVRERVCVHAGDVTEPRLGLTDEAWVALASDVDLIIGSAATVVFDERLDLALETNARGPLRLLELAREAGVPYTHVSTTYVCGALRGDIPERLLHPSEVDEVANRALAGRDFDPDAEVERLDACVAHACAAAEDEIWRLEPAGGVSESRRILREGLVRAGLDESRGRGWHDTYTYTKYLGEHLLAVHRGRVPVTIVRPSIIESCAVEPEPGWITGLRVADPMIVSFGRGRLSDFPARREGVLDLIPVDHVANAVLAASAATGTRAGALEVYHVSTSRDNPLTMGRLHDSVRAHFLAHPLLDKRGRPIAVPSWSWSSDQRRRAPAVRPVRRPATRRPERRPRFRAFRRLRARLRSARAGLAQLRYFLEMYGPYVELDCRFDTARSARLRGIIAADEREHFAFDPDAITWERYLEDVHVPGLRRFVLGHGEVRLAPGERRVVDRVGEGSRWRVEVDRVLRPSPPRAFVRGVVGTLLGALLRSRLGIEVRGGEHLPEGAFILAANHASHLDTAAIRHAVGPLASRVCVTAARDYFFDTVLKRWFYPAVFNTVPLDRERGDLGGLGIARCVLERGGALLVYPEGTRSLTGEILPFKAGVGVLALELGVPVVPVHVQGTWEAMPKGRRWPRSGRVRVSFGAPMVLAPPDGSAGDSRGPWPKASYRAAAVRIRDAVRALAAEA